MARFTSSPRSNILYKYHRKKILYVKKLKYKYGLLNIMSFERKTKPDGSDNPKYVDLLDEDRPLANQKFVCVSFVSPENILKDKKNFFFEEFLKDWEFTKATEKYTQFLNFIGYKYNIEFEKLTNDLQEFIKSERDNLINTTVLDEYKNFVDRNEEKLESKFSETIAYQTSTRGLKVRGVYPTQQEAEMRCKLLREVDPHHDVYVGPVGMWMPWDPEAYKTGRVEYLEDELNQLMHEKKSNEAKAKQEFDKRVREAKETAIEKNKKLAAETGNKLTQNIDEEGNLYSIDSSGANNDISVADIRKELFESENVVIGPSDHGLSQLTNPPSELKRTDSTTVTGDEVSEKKDVAGDNVEFNVEEIDSIEVSADSEKIDPSNQSI